MDIDEENIRAVLSDYAAPFDEDGFEQRMLTRLALREKQRTSLRNALICAVLLIGFALSGTSLWGCMKLAAQTGWGASVSGMLHPSVLAGAVACLCVTFLWALMDRGAGPVIR